MAQPNDAGIAGGQLSAEERARREALRQSLLANAAKYAPRPAAPRASATSSTAYDPLSSANTGKPAAARTTPRTVGATVAPSPEEIMRQRPAPVPAAPARPLIPTVAPRPSATSSTAYDPLSSANTGRPVYRPPEPPPAPQRREIPTRGYNFTDGSYTGATPQQRAQEVDWAMLAAQATARENALRREREMQPAPFKVQAEQMPVYDTDPYPGWWTPPPDFSQPATAERWTGQPAEQTGLPQEPPTRELFPYDWRTLWMNPELAPGISQGAVQYIEDRDLVRTQPGGAAWVNYSELAAAERKRAEEAERLAAMGLPTTYMPYSEEELRAMESSADWYNPLFAAASLGGDLAFYGPIKEIATEFVPGTARTDDQGNPIPDTQLTVGAGFGLMVDALWRAGQVAAAGNLMAQQSQYAPDMAIVRSAEQQMDELVAAAQTELPASAEALRDVNVRIAQANLPAGPVQGPPEKSQVEPPPTLYDWYAEAKRNYGIVPVGPMTLDQTIRVAQRDPNYFSAVTIDGVNQAITDLNKQVEQDARAARYLANVRPMTYGEWQTEAPTFYDALEQLGVVNGQGVPYPEMATLIASSGAEAQTRVLENFEMKAKLPEIRELRNRMLWSGSENGMALAMSLNSLILRLESTPYSDLVDLETNFPIELLENILLDPFNLVDIPFGKIASFHLAGKVADATTALRTADNADDLATLSRLFRDAYKPWLEGGRVGDLVFPADAPADLIRLLPTANELRGPGSWLGRQLARTPETQVHLSANNLWMAMSNVLYGVDNVDDAIRILRTATEAPQEMIKGLAGLTSPTFRAVADEDGLVRWGPGVLTNKTFLRETPIFQAGAAKVIERMEKAQQEAMKAAKKAGTFYDGTKQRVNPLELLVNLNIEWERAARQLYGIAPIDPPANATKVAMRDLANGTAQVEFLDDADTVLRQLPPLPTAQARTQLNTLQAAMTEAKENPLYKAARVSAEVQRHIMSDMWLNLRPAHWMRNATAFTLALNVDGLYSFKSVPEMFGELGKKAIGGQMTHRLAEGSSGAGTLGELTVQHWTRKGWPKYNPLAWMAEHGAKVWTGYGQILGAVPFGEQAGYLTGYNSAFNRLFGGDWTTLTKQELNPLFASWGVDPDLARAMIDKIVEVGRTGSKADVAQAARQMIRGNGQPFSVRGLGVADGVIPVDNNVRIVDAVNSLGRSVNGTAPRSAEQVQQEIRRVTELIRAEFDQMRRRPGAVLAEAMPPPSTVAPLATEATDTMARLVDDALADAQNAGITDPHLLAVIEEEAQQYARRLVEGETLGWEGVLDEMANAPDDRAGLVVAFDLLSQVYELKRMARQEVDDLMAPVHAAQNADELSEAWAAKFAGTEEIYTRLADDLQAVFAASTDTLRRIAAGEETPQQRDWWDVITRYLDFDARANIQDRDVEFGNMMQEDPAIVQKVIDANRAYVDSSYIQLYDMFRRYPSLDALDILRLAQQQIDVEGARAAAMLRDTRKLIKHFDENSKTMVGFIEKEEYYVIRNDTWRKVFDNQVIFNQAAARAIAAHALAMGSPTQLTWTDDFFGGTFQLIGPATSDPINNAIALTIDDIFESGAFDAATGKIADGYLAPKPLARQGKNANRWAITPVETETQMQALAVVGVTEKRGGDWYLLIRDPDAAAQAVAERGRFAWLARNVETGEIAVFGSPNPQAPIPGRQGSNARVPGAVMQDFDALVEGRPFPPGAADDAGGAAPTPPPPGDAGPTPPAGPGSLPPDGSGGGYPAQPFTDTGRPGRSANVPTVPQEVLDAKAVQSDPAAFEQAVDEEIGKVTPLEPRPEDDVIPEGMGQQEWFDAQASVDARMQAAEAEADIAQPLVIDFDALEAMPGGEWQRGPLPAGGSGAGYPAQPFTDTGRPGQMQPAPQPVTLPPVTAGTLNQLAAGAGIATSKADGTPTHRHLINAIRKDAKENNAGWTLPTTLVKAKNGQVIEVTTDRDFLRWVKEQPAQAQQAAEWLAARVEKAAQLAQEPKPVKAPKPKKGKAAAQPAAAPELAPAAAPTLAPARLALPVQNLDELTPVESVTSPWPLPKKIQQRMGSEGNAYMEARRNLPPGGSGAGYPAQPATDTGRPGRPYTPPADAAPEAPAPAPRPSPLAPSATVAPENVVTPAEMTQQAAPSPSPVPPAQRVNFLSGQPLERREKAQTILDAKPTRNAPQTRREMAEAAFAQGVRAEQRQDGLWYIGDRNVTTTEAEYLNYLHDSAGTYTPGVAPATTTPAPRVAGEVAPADDLLRQFPDSPRPVAAPAPGTLGQDVMNQQMQMAGRERYYDQTPAQRSAALPQMVEQMARGTGDDRAFARGWMAEMENARAAAQPQPAPAAAPPRGDTPPAGAMTPETPAEAPAGQGMAAGAPLYFTPQETWQWRGNGWNLDDYARAKTLEAVGVPDDVVDVLRSVGSSGDDLGGERKYANANDIVFRNRWTAPDYSRPGKSVLTPAGKEALDRADAAIAELRKTPYPNVAARQDDARRAADAAAAAPTEPAAAAQAAPPTPWHNATADDIRQEDAARAFYWSSSDPDGRGRRWRDGYVNHMDNVAAELAPYADTPEKQAILREELERYRARYLEFNRKLLGQESRTASAMVTGPANFPVERNRKAMDALQKTYDEMREWSQKAQTAIERKLRPEIAPITGSDAGALAKLQAKAADLEAQQQRMVNANKIIRGKAPQETKVAQLKALGLDDEEIQARLVKGNVYGTFGYESFTLTNNSAEIRRVKERIAQLEKLGNVRNQTTEWAFDGGRVVDNVEEDRVQIIFDAKPSAEEHDKLRKSGFVYSRKNQAYQRGRLNARRAVHDRTGIDINKPPAAPAQAAEAAEAAADAAAAPPARAVPLPALEDEAPVLAGVEEVGSPGAAFLEAPSAATFRPMMRRAFNLTDQQAEAVDMLARARANVWARQTGRSADEWYGAHFAGIVQGGVIDDDALLQALDYNTPEFRQWFEGASGYVRNEDGTAKRFYHGTGAGEFDAFDPARANDGALYGPGFYFTEDPDIAAGLRGAGLTDAADPDTAAWLNSGYAWANPQWELTQPLTKKQMDSARRWFESIAIQKEAASDIGIRRTLSAGYRALNESPEAFARWLAEHRPELRARLGVERRLLTQPSALPVHLNVNNPFNINSYYRLNDFRLRSAHLDSDSEAGRLIDQAIEQLDQRAKRYGVSSFNGDQIYDELHARAGTKAKVNELLQALGYDGITHIGGNNYGRAPHRVVIAFEPNQVKSVFNTRPTSDPRLLYQSAADAQTRTPEFQAWFGDSKVVDEQGQPLRMYHGTGSGEFDAFLPEKASPLSLYGPGFYFTEDPEVAGGWIANRERWTYHNTREAAEAVPDRTHWVWKDDSTGKYIAVTQEPHVKRKGYAWRRGGEDKVVKTPQGYSVSMRVVPQEQIDEIMQFLEQSDHWKYLHKKEYAPLTTSEAAQLDRHIEGFRESGNLYEIMYLDQQPYGLPITEALQRAGVEAPGSVYPVHLSIQNPFKIDEQLGQINTEQFFDELEGYLDDLARSPDNPYERTTVWGDPTPAREATQDVVQKARSTILGDYGKNRIVTHGTIYNEIGYQLRQVYAEPLRVMNDFLKSQGYDGITHIGGANTGTEPHRVYIAFEPNQIKTTWNTRPTSDPRLLRQQRNAMARGAAQFLDDGTAILRGLESPDVSTAVHEMAHVFRRDLATVAGLDAQAAEDMRILHNWVKLEPGQAWTREAEEQFARGFETYLQSGKAPTPELQSAFARFKAWLAEIYRALRGEAGPQITPEMRGVYDRLLAEAPAPAAQPAAPAATLRKSGWTDDAPPVSAQQVIDHPVVKWLADHAKRTDYPDGSITYYFKGNLPGQMYSKLSSDLFVAHRAKVAKYREPVFNFSAEPHVGYSIQTSQYKGQTQVVFVMNDERIPAAAAAVGTTPAPNIRQNIIDFLRGSPNASDAEIRFATGRDLPYDYMNPMDNPVHQELAAMEKEGLITVQKPTAVYQVPKFKLADAAATTPRPAPAPLPPTQRGLVGSTVKGWSDPARQYDFQYEIVKLDDLIASNLDDGRINPRYPAELQPRDRTQQASQLQVAKMAGTLSPDELLTPTNAIDRGAPIVGPDNVIESGNGRVLAMRKAPYETYGQYTDALINRIRQTGGQFGTESWGITPEAFDAWDAATGRTRYVLIRRRVSDVDRVKFAQEANARVTLGMNQVEAGKTLANNLEAGDLMTLYPAVTGKLDDAFLLRENQDAVRRILAKIPRNEQAAYLDASGQLNPEGSKAIRSALFSIVFPDNQKIVRNYVDTLDTDMRNIGNGIERAIIDLAKVQLQNPDLGIGGEIAAAIDIVAQARAERTSVARWFDTPSFFEKPVALRPLAQAIDENIRSGKVIGRIFTNYAAEALKHVPGQASLLGDELRPDKIGMLNAAIAKLQDADDGQLTLYGGFGAIDPRPAMQEIYQTMIRYWRKPRQPVMGDVALHQVTSLNDAEDRILAALPALAQPRRNNFTAAQANALIDAVDKRLLPAFDDAVSRASYGAQKMADTAMLNYRDRRGIDATLALFLPYHYFYTRGGATWLRRIARKPSVAAMYYDIQKAIETENKQAHVPNRFKGTIPLWNYPGGQIRMANPLNTMIPFYMYMPDPFQNEEGDTDVERMWTALKNFAPGVMPVYDVAMAAVLDQIDPLPDGESRVARYTNLRNYVPLAGTASDAAMAQGGIVTPTNLGGDPFDPYRVKRTAGVMAQQGAFSDEMARYVIQLSVNLEGGGDPWANIPADQTAAVRAAYIATVNQTGRDKLLMGSGAGYLLGANLYNFPYAERELQSAQDLWRYSGFGEQNPAGSAAQRSMVMEQNPALGAYMARSATPGAPYQPGQQAQANALYDRLDPLYAQQGAIEDQMITQSGYGVSGDALRAATAPIQGEIDAARAQYPNLPAATGKPRSGSNPAELAEWMLRQAVPQGGPVYPGKDAPKAELQAYYDARDAWEKEKLATFQRNLTTVMAGNDPAQDEINFELYRLTAGKDTATLLREYGSGYYDSPTRREYDARNAERQATTTAKFDAAESLILQEFGQAGLDVYKGYAATEQAGREAYKKAHPELKALNLAAYNPEQYRQAVELFGKDAILAWAKMPPSDGSEAASAARAAYNDANPGAYLMNAWMNGRPTPFGETIGPWAALPSQWGMEYQYNFGKDFNEAATRFGADIWQIVAGYKRGWSSKEKAAYFDKYPQLGDFFDWWNELLPDDGKGSSSSSSSGRSSSRGYSSYKRYYRRSGYRRRSYGGYSRSYGGGGWGGGGGWNDEEKAPWIDDVDPRWFDRSLWNTQSELRRWEPPRPTDSGVERWRPARYGYGGQ